MVYHFREEGFPMSQKAVVTKRRGRLWHFSCTVPSGWILFPGDFVPMSAHPAWWVRFFLVLANFYFFTHFSYLHIANFVSPLFYPLFSDYFEANPRQGMTFKARAILTCGCHHLDIPYAQCVWNGVLVPLPPQPAKPVAPASPFTRLWGALELLLPLVHPFSVSSACSSLRSLNCSLCFICFSSWRGPIPTSPTATHNNHQSSSLSQGVPTKPSAGKDWGCCAKAECSGLPPHPCPRWPPVRSSWTEVVQWPYFYKLISNTLCTKPTGRPTVPEYILCLPQDGTLHSLAPGSAPPFYTGRTPVSPKSPPPTPAPARLSPPRTQ